MRAAVLRNPSSIDKRPVLVEEVFTPMVTAGQVLVRIGACGVCRSNLHMIEGDWLPRGVPSKLPIIPGHEIVGRIVEVGENVDSYGKGDRVGITPLWSSCGKCKYCLSGRRQLCKQRKMTGEDVDGGFAEYMVANADSVYPVPEILSDTASATLMCAGVTAFRAVKKSRLTPFKRVAVFGIGGVGHFVLQFAKMTGAEVIAVSRSQIHLDLARELGASTVINALENEPAAELTRTGGVDVAIVFAPSDYMVEQGVRAIKPDGTVVLGVFEGLSKSVLMDERRIIGTLIGSVQDIQKVLQLAAAGRIKPVVDEFKLDDIDQAFGMLKDSKIRARAVVTP